MYLIQEVAADPELDTYTSDGDLDKIQLEGEYESNAPNDTSDQEITGTAYRHSDMIAFILNINLLSFSNLPLLII